jgi:hypothetical protein
MISRSLAASMSFTHEATHHEQKENKGKPLELAAAVERGH